MHTSHPVAIMHRSPTTDAMHYGTRFDCTLNACIGDDEPDCVSPEPARCEGCDAPLAVHVGGRSCVMGTVNTARSIHDLPIARWAHAESLPGADEDLEALYRAETAHLL
jgi:hypothetical protein